MTLPRGRSNDERVGDNGVDGGVVDVGGVGDVGVLTILFSKSSFVKLAGKWALFVSLIMMFT